MAADKEPNGYARLQSVLQLVGAAGAVLALYISLSVAPMQKDIDQNKSDIRDIRGQIVPRSEHVEKWNSQRDRDAEIQREIDQIRLEIGSQWSVGKELENINNRLDKIETHR